MTTEILVAKTTAAHRTSQNEFVYADISIMERSRGGFHVSIRKRDGSPAEEWYLTPKEATGIFGAIPATHHRNQDYTQKICGISRRAHADVVCTNVFHQILLLSDSRDVSGWWRVFFQWNSGAGNPEGVD